jgi:CRP-like cAMP-binding protein
MHSTMSERGLRLRLEAGQSLPIHVCWRIEDGYLRATSWTNQRDVFTLGIWGPGEVIIPQLLAQKPIELRTLSSAQVQEWSPDPAHHHACVQGHIQQIATLLELTRIRPAEARLFSLLVWLGERFGTSTAQGRSVPLDPLNLTHRQLAEMASVSRVTVTKALGHFRQLGWLQRTGELDVLSEAGVAAVRGLR